MAILSAFLSGAEAPNMTAPGHVGVIAFKHVNVIAMDRESVAFNQTVIIRDGRVESVAPAKSATIPANATVIESRGKYLMPGLTDFHVHVRAESELLSYLAYGVTTVVNLRGSELHLAMRERIRRGELLGPTIYTSGPLVDGDPPIWRNSRMLVDPQLAAGAVEEHLRAGYNLIKIYNNLSPDALTALTAAAKARGIAVVGHVPRNPDRSTALQRALKAGVAMIAHSEEYFFTHFAGASDAAMKKSSPPEPDTKLIPEVARTTQQAAVYVTPNLSFPMMTLRQLRNLQTVYSDPEFRFLDSSVQRLWENSNPTRRPDLEPFLARERVKYRFLRRLTRGFRDAGVLLLLGTDASAPGMFPGKSAHQELQELVSAGLTPYQAFAAATRNAGEFVAAHVAGAEKFGTVSPGARADLILLQKNPLQNVAVVEKLEGVMVRGRWLPIAQIRQMRFEAMRK